MNKSISIVGMFVLLAGAYALDTTFQGLQLVAGRTFSASAFATLAWLRPVSLLAFALAALALAWFVLLRSERSTAVVTTYAVVGLLLTAVQTIAGLSFLNRVFHSDQLYVMITRILATPLALVPNSVAFIAMIGLIGLVLKAAPGLLPTSHKSTPNEGHKTISGAA